MKKKYFLILFILSIYSPLKAQVQLSAYAEVSIVTAGPGGELYEAFGHSAIRIKDPVLNLDLIYNYGMFDFNQPNFLLNFAKGNMIYSLARYDFKYFLASYRRDKRWVKQQVLNLSQQEKQAYFIFLETNASPENRNYLYDPYFDNCATKLRDITKSILGSKLVFNDTYLEKELTFRELTNHEIPWNAWGTFGLNLIAGTKLDQKSTYEEYMYLPDYVYSSFKNATVYIKNQPKELVKREDILVRVKEKQPKTALFNPFLIFSIIALLGIYITYKDYIKNRRTKWLDFVLFFTTGFIGCVLFFLWFFSTHSTAPNNFNLLWAFAPNLIIAFLLLNTKQQKRWLQKYLFVLIVLLLLIPVLWILKIQVFPIVVTPLLILLIIRYYFLSKRLLTFIK
ncbi:lipoprotein N-acyltransferase Lnb domain-containing protein [Polaribacter sp. SA4-12]|uniref:lipoprotein N-acyltransferase Lnb domain-containing protein n=1 Tax=Polaribacter sp. SA4-12 TaxID=1312072 RepID=UPI000B3C2B6C|nr:DUF4105 domain-containing protein [Polaribacter sp. SA4-12]ARV13823.1 hypothetical protein BTO07_01095 [Polaribacter sp. SA4-12]